MKYPTVHTLLNKEYQESYPIYPTVKKPSKPSVFLTIFAIVFEVLFIVDLILDFVNGKELMTIIIDIVIVVLYAGISLMVAFLWNDYRHTKKLYNELNDFEILSEGNPAVMAKKVVAYYNRDKYISARNTADFEFGKIRSRAPKKYERLVNQATASAEENDNIMRVVLKDPAILKQFANFDKSEAKLVATIVKRHEELSKKNPEELAKLEKDFDHLDDMRKFSRKWIQKKRK